MKTNAGRRRGGSNDIVLKLLVLHFTLRALDIWECLSHTHTHAHTKRDTHTDGDLCIWYANKRVVAKWKWKWNWWKSPSREGGREVGRGSNRQKLPTAKMYCRGERGEQEQEQEQKVQSNRQQSDNCNWRISILSCISACCAISFEYISDQSLADSVCLCVCLSVCLCASICDREGGRKGERERVG